MEIWQHWTEVGDYNFKNQLLETIKFCLVKIEGHFWLVYFVFSLILMGIQGFVLVFPPISQQLQATWLGLVQLFYLPFLDPW